MERVTVIDTKPEDGGYLLTLDCWHLSGPDAHTVQHTTWRKHPVKYVMRCDACEYQEELWSDYWSSVF